MRLFALIWLTACVRPHDAGPDTADTAIGASVRPALLLRTDCTDQDSDDWCAAEDCDDLNPAISPGASEQTGDGVDQDCDGRERCWVDADRDGAPGLVALDITSLDCSAEGFVAGGEPDCNDADPAALPGGVEVPGNQSDEDCDGQLGCFVDADFDGFGAGIGQTDRSCADPGFSLLDGDCDDTRPLVSPRNFIDLPGNGFDDNCDGLHACWLDGDEDGQGGNDEITGTHPACDGPRESSRNGDCDDDEPTAYLGAPELPADGVDNDCDGADACLVDVDGDGWAPDATPLPTGDGDCDDPGEGGAGTQVGDCDDNNPTFHPDAEEVPSDGLDNTCDGQELCWTDLDRDSYHGLVPVPGPLSCAGPGLAAFDAPGGDCADEDFTIHPGIIDVPADGRDADCDGSEQCYFDRDGDGFRTSFTEPGSPTCTAPGEDQGALPGGDCDDNSDISFPGGTESPDDGVDGDCNGSELCALDADNDGYRGAVTLSAPLDCQGPGLGAPLGGDCNDGDLMINPGRPEMPGDGADSDCSGAELCFTDADGDGYRSDVLVDGPASCADPGLADLSSPAGDCDDGDRLISPAGGEVAGDGVDSDCDGEELCYVDADDDGHRTGTLVPGSAGCAGPGEALLSEPDDDCDDTEARAFPGQPDIIGDGVDGDCDGVELCYVDEDGDGFHTGATAIGSGSCEGPGLAAPDAVEGDCDDRDERVFPAAEEAAGDGLDANCDGVELCFRDDDRDGFRTVEPFETTPGCAADGAVFATLPSGDCDDQAPGVNPDAIETPGDGADSDCDGVEQCYTDADGDGYRVGDLQPGPLACDAPGLADNRAPTSDCDDRDPDVRPEGVELPADGRDGDCNGLDLCFVDADNDGYRISTLADGPLGCDADGFALATVPAGDCDDTEALINPGAEEIPADRRDADCDGGDLCYADFDGDGYRGDLPRPGTLDCDGPGEVLASFQAGDCDDDDPTVNPDAVDLPADGVDSDCNGQDLCYVDADDDGYRTDIPVPGDGTCSGPGLATGQEPTGDCDDRDGSAYPGAFEAPGDGHDADCDGGDLCWLDLDGDGFHGDSLQPGPLACDGEGQVTEEVPGDDCADDDSARNPGAEEVVADGIDSDCDGEERCYTDRDGDGFRTESPRRGTLTCTGPGEVTFDTPSGDCDDDDEAISPVAEEGVADGVDSDCDGAEICFRDADQDGFHGAETTTGPLDCNADGLGRLGSPGGDCDEGRPEVHPGATELPGDGIDSDCDRADLCFVDGDGDGYRTEQTAPGSPACSAPGQALGNRPSGDCADADVDIHPGVADAPADGVDSDCDDLEQCYEDADRDGYRTEVLVTGAPGCVGPGEALASVTGGDCDDRASARNPTATEIEADGVDSDCDGRELCFIDDDRDGFHADQLGDGPLDCVGRELVPPEAGGDCDDGDSTRAPNAPESPADGIDSDCDGGDLCWVDHDGDGYRFGDPVVGPLSCAGFAPPGVLAGDCDDNAAGVRPGAAEVPVDGVDNNCDGQELCWVDADDDDYHAGATTRGPLDCSGAGIAGPEALSGDCADRDAARNPGAADTPADGLDSDCDGQELCYVDADDDGYRTERTAPGSLGCTAPGEALADLPTGDCDDGDAARRPGTRDDAGDGVDADCDGAERCFVDADGDGWRTESVAPGSIGCAAAGEALLSTPAGDCDDDEPLAHPQGTEVTADGIDGDCNNREQCWVDRDNDGWRDGDASVVSTDLDCDDAGEADGTASTGDCDDNDNATHPDATELPGDRNDSDCDGGDLCFVDADGDGVRMDTTVPGSVTCDGAGEAVATLPGPDCDDDDPLAPTPNGCDDDEPIVDDKDPVDEGGGGCSCDQGGGGAWGLAGLLAALGLRRRARQGPWMAV